MFLSAAGKAQFSHSGTASGNITVFSVQSLTLTGSTIIPSFESFSHYTNGITMSQYVEIQVRSNVNWTISVQAQNAYFSPLSQGASTNMPSTVLSMKRSDVSSYTPVSPSGHTLKNGGKGGAGKPGNTFTVDVRFHPGFGFKGGIYTLGLLYTLSQQ